MHALRLRPRKIAAWVLPLLALPAWAGAPSASAADITITVATVRNQEGEIIRALFDTAESFVKRIPLARAVARPEIPATTCVFRNVQAGIHAVTAIHDENDNGRLDRTFFGGPTEGYGVSNDHTYVMHGPRFSESKFSFSGARNLAIAIELHYP